MMAKTICAACGQHIEFPNEMLGREVICPNCRAKTMLDPPGTPAFRIPKSAFRDPAEREPGNSPVAPLAERIIANIEKVVIGKRAEIVLTLVAYLAEGHVLLEDVPGVAKTMLARALAAQHRLLVQTHSMHARSAAQRHHRQFHFQPQNDRIRVSTGAALCPNRPGGRNQPRHAARPGRPARSDGRAQSHRRRQPITHWPRRSF